MTVYVLETGIYESVGVIGVFSTPEAAFAAWPKGDWRAQDGYWINGLDWDDAGRVFPFELDQSAAP